MTSPFTPVVAGSADSTQPATPKNVPNRGGAANPTADALRTQFADAVRRVDVVWGETTVIVDRARVLDIVRWLHEDPNQRYDFLADVTAVEKALGDLARENRIRRARSVPARATGASA